MSAINPTESTPEDTWPGVNAAYDFVIPSYQWMLARFEASSTRLQTLLGFVATITLGIPAIATAIRQEIQFASPWFISALFLFGVIMVIGLIVRAWGSIALADLNILYQNYLHEPEWEFKKDAIYWASKHFHKNTVLINTKAWLATVMTVLFLVETIFLLIWLAGGPAPLLEAISSLFSAFLYSL